LRAETVKLIEKAANAANRANRIAEELEGVRLQINELR